MCVRVICQTKSVVYKKIVWLQLSDNDPKALATIAKMISQCLVTKLPLLYVVSSEAGMAISGITSHFLRLGAVVVGASVYKQCSHLRGVTSVPFHFRGAPGPAEEKGEKQQPDPRLDSIWRDRV